MNGLFITGTDTGVGKTVVTAAILAVLRARGTDAVPMKPVQTGCTAGRLGPRAPDLEFSLSAAGLSPAAEEKELMSPYRFAAACSPHLAARLARRRIFMRSIAAAYRRLAANHRLVLVEGAGGVLVPIGGGKVMLDVMKTVAAPVVIVSRPGLGTINHTLLTIQAVRSVRLEVRGVVFNHAVPGSPGYIEEDNVSAVKRYGRVPVLGVLPHVTEMDELRRSPPAFAKWAGKLLDIGTMLSGIVQRGGQS